METNIAQPEQCISNIAKLFQESYPGRAGKISRDELLRFLTLVTHDAIPNASLEQVVNAADKDGTGMVNIEEFLSWLFSQAKANGPEDGSALTVTKLFVALGTPAVGVGMVYLAKPRKEVPHVDMLSEHDEPAFGDTIEKFRELHKDDGKLLATLNNTVKVCGVCKKPNAYTLSNCNSCGASLASTPVSYTDNVFMGFIYGIAKGRFPYRISMRAQTEDYLCFDDPLAVTVCHLNCIPTSVYIPDMRYLFSDPLRALGIVNKLYEVAAKACLEQFWSNEDFCRKYFGGQSKPVSAEAVLEYACCGLNCPPSMYQLHLQFIHPPLLPFHYSLFMQDAHFTHGRFFPLEYVQKALELGDAVKMTVTGDTDIEELIRKVDALGVNYDAYHSALMRKVKRAQKLFSPWQESDFSHQVVNGKVFSLLGGVTAAPELETQAVHKEDTLALQNYGRPYKDGKPSGTYYRYPKKAGAVLHFQP